MLALADATGGPLVLSGQKATGNPCGKADSDTLPDVPDLATSGKLPRRLSIYRHVGQRQDRGTRDATFHVECRWCLAAWRSGPEAGVTDDVTPDRMGSRAELRPPIIASPSPFPMRCST